MSTTRHRLRQDFQCDVPEYSPDGKYIYFNSNRTGLEQIWRMHSESRTPAPAGIVK